MLDYISFDYIARLLCAFLVIVKKEEEKKRIDAFYMRDREVQLNRINLKIEMLVAQNNQCNVYLLLKVKSSDYIINTVRIHWCTGTYRYSYKTTNSI